MGEQTTNTMATTLFNEGNFDRTREGLEPFFQQDIVGNVILIPYQSDFDFRIAPEFRSNGRVVTKYLGDDSHKTNIKALSFGELEEDINYVEYSKEKRVA